RYSKDEEERKHEKVLKCPDCGAEDDDIGYDDGEHYCKKCGAIIEEASNIDED
ncbi:hypothetical protein COY28_06180, partial [Candidatus Woesearchaeota archaeon CG_4_10_14_0_2_um_filter_57_5]